MLKSSQNKVKGANKIDLPGSQSKLKKRKKLLVLDLDETLVHIVEEAASPPKQYDIRLPISKLHSTKRPSFVYVQVRPGFSKFLLKMSLHY